MTDTSGSPKGVEDDLWSKPDETINEKIKDLCPIVITTIDCRPTKFKDGDDVLTVKLWNDEYIGPWLYKKSGHMYQTTDPALDYYLTSMKEHCDPDSDKC